MSITSHECCQIMNPFMKSEPSWPKHLPKAPPLTLPALGPSIQEPFWGNISSPNHHRWERNSTFWTTELQGHTGKEANARRGWGIGDSSALKFLPLIPWLFIPSEHHHLHHVLELQNHLLVVISLGPLVPTLQAGKLRPKEIYSTLFKGKNSDGIWPKSPSSWHRSHPTASGCVAFLVPCCLFPGPQKDSELVFLFLAFFVSCTSWGLGSYMVTARGCFWESTMNDSWIWVLLSLAIHQANAFACLGNP
jgi:hypothetical protein